jgi:hypothetical protein
VSHREVGLARRASTGMWELACSSGLPDVNGAICLVVTGISTPMTVSLVMDWKIYSPIFRAVRRKSSRDAFPNIRRRDTV